MAVLAAMACVSPAAAQPQPEQTGAVLTFDAAFFTDARPSTAYDMVKRLPGFTLDLGDTNARGFAGSAGNILIDGQRPTSKTDTLDSIISRIPASEVERIEIIRGGAPGIDMQGKTVVANIVRKKVASTSVVLDVTDNIFADGHTVPSLSVQLTSNEGDRTYEGSLSRYGAYDDSVGIGRRTFTDYTGILGPQPDDRENRRAVGYGWGFTGAADIPLWSGRFKANLAYQDTPFRSDLTFTHPGYQEDIISRTGGQNGELGLHWDGSISDFEIETLALQRLGRSTNYNVFIDTAPTDQRFLSTNKTSESILRGTARYHWSPTVTLEGGLEGAYNYLDGTSTFTDQGVLIPLPSANATVNEKRGEVFGQGTWKITPALTLEGGARFEYSVISESGDTKQSRSFFYPKPRLLLSYSENENTQYRLRYERILGQLDFGNFVATSDLGGSGVSAGNANLKPDQRDQYEFSYEHHFMEKGAIVVTLLHEEIKDVVDLVAVTDPKTGDMFDAPGNIGAGTNNQVDVELTLPLDWLGITNGLLKTTSILRSSRVHDPVTHDIRVISAQRPQDIEFAFTQDLDSLKSTWGINYFNGWRERYYRLNEYRDRKIPPGLLSVFWEYKPTPDWMLHLEVDNLTRFIYDDKHYAYVFNGNTRGSGAPDFLEERVVRSQPRLYFEIRKTFN
ncbi:MAG TPA: TonB-dependent receptor [Rhizomicrobium sp.]|nr:TonB-dependent receptor [Rhizomicrobium sp.]